MNGLTDGCVLLWDDVTPTPGDLLELEQEIDTEVYDEEGEDACYVDWDAALAR